MTTLATLKTSLLSLLADHGDVHGWEDELLDEAVRRGLWAYGQVALTSESSVTVATKDYELDLSALDASTIFSVAYPWEDGAVFAREVIAFRLVSPTTIRADMVEFQVDEVARVRYRKRYAVEDLDGATATTVDDDEISTLLLSCASKAYELRYRQLSRLPSSPEGEAAAALLLSDRLRSEFETAMLVTRDSGVVSWGDVGL